MPDAGRGGDVGEAPVFQVAKESMARPDFRRRRERAAVNEEQIDPAVVVVVEERRARAHGLDEVLVGAGAVDV